MPPTHRVEIKVPSHLRDIVRHQMLEHGGTDRSGPGKTDPIIGEFPSSAQAGAFKEIAEGWREFGGVDPTRQKHLP